MFQNSAFRQDALNMESIKDKTEDWKKTRNEKYIREAGWHFKTLAVQEVGAYLQNTVYHIPKLAKHQRVLTSICSEIPLANLGVHHELKRGKKSNLAGKCTVCFKG